MKDKYEKLGEISKLRNDLCSLVDSDSKFQQRDLFHKKAALIIKNIFGENNQYLRDWRKIRIPIEPPINDDTNVFINYLHDWNIAEQQMVNLFIVMEQDLAESKESKVDTIPTPDKSESRSNTVFVVHGKDEAMKHSVARAIEKLGLEPIILHEQPNEGRTVIEKFTDYSNVGFAIVLLSPDDFGCSREEGSAKGKFRARQNVILELGFFIGKLGRKNVMPIYRVDPNFEMPSDYNGVVYTPFDANEQWKTKLVKELKACGYKVDANKII